ncbi:MAG: hypothetical protein H6622_00115 [Halobacteriovoraceae bacterium]|nr:hypothetical protein [Halobacteriovoraceae bacterium]
MKTATLFALFLLVSCNKDKVEVSSKIVSNSSSNFSNQIKSEVRNEDDFADLKEKKDAGCEDEQKVEAKLTEKKEEVFQLQGGDTGCDTNAESKH